MGSFKYHVITFRDIFNPHPSFPSHHHLAHYSGKCLFYDLWDASDQLLISNLSPFPKNTLHDPEESNLISV